MERITEPWQADSNAMAEPSLSHRQAADLTNGATLTDERTDLRTTTKTRNTRLVPNAPTPVDNPDFDLPADHAFTAFLAGLTPGRVLRDREAGLSKVERKRARYLAEPKRRGRPRNPLPEPYEFTARQLEIALQATLHAARREGK